MKYIVRHVIRSSSAVIKGLNLLWLSSVFPQIVARGDYFFSHQMGVIIQGRVIDRGGVGVTISNITCWKSFHSEYFVLLSHLIIKQSQSL